MSRDMVYENVPTLSRRVGDSVVAGANNSTILLGRDRLGSVGSGYGSVDAPGGGKSAGAIHMVVGRKSEDPDIDEDSATLYMSQKNDPDVTADTSNILPVSTAVSSVVCRADCIRMVPRRDFKLAVGSAQLTITSEGKVIIDGDISLGKNAIKKLILAEDFAAFWSGVVIVSPAGPCNPLPPIPSSCFTRKVSSE